MKANGLSFEDHKIHGEFVSIFLIYTSLFHKFSFGEKWPKKMCRQELKNVLIKSKKQSQMKE